MGKGELLGSGMRMGVCAIAATAGTASATRTTTVRRLRNASSWLNLLSNHVDGADGGECGALLPADDVAGVVTREVDAPVGMGQSGIVARILAAETVGLPRAADPGAEVERYLTP